MDRNFYLKFIVIVSLFAMIITSCSKEEGIGGTAVITGKLKIINYSEDSPGKIDTLVAAGEDVYIIYGDNNYFNNDIETNFDGTFKFSYLNKGTYTVYAYSRDTSGTDQEIAIKKQVEIAKNGETVDIGTIYVYDGQVGSTIMGKIIKLDYLADYTNVIDTNFAAGEDVYISFKNGDYFIDDIETYLDGSFIFNGLENGVYTIYVYSNDKLGTGQEVAITKDVTINGTNLVIDIGEIEIYKNIVGTSTITGKVRVTAPWNDYYAPDEDVYIIYEDNKTFFERARTNHDGTYEFKELIPGKYTVYAYTKDPGQYSGVDIVSIEVNISGVNQNINLSEDIIILK